MDKTVLNVDEVIKKGKIMKTETLGEFIEILESGITYEQLVDMFTLDALIFMKKMNDLENMRLKGKIDVFKENEILNTQTNIISKEDYEEKVLALRLVDDFLYE